MALLDAPLSEILRGSEDTERRVGRVGASAVVFSFGLAVCTHYTRQVPSTTPSSSL